MARVKARVRMTAAAIIGLGLAVGLATGCQQTTEGVVAQTTEPGPPLTTERRTPGFPGLPDIQIPNIPLPTRNPDLPEVPPPPNALTMGCREFNKLDDATKLAVVREILSQEGNPLGPNGEFVGQIMAEAACQFLPSATVSDVLLGS